MKYLTGCTHFFLLLFSVTTSLQASTILQVDVNYLLNQSSLVFEGKVLSKQANWNTAHTAIKTEITFRVDEVIKGKYEQPTLTLTFAGGVVEDQGMSVSSMVYPKVNKKGIYFVENLNNSLINPLVGWSQGHFLLEADSKGVERILTEAGAPVVNFTVEPVTVDNFLPAKSQADNQHSTQQPQPHQSVFSEGIAKGLDVGETIKKNDNKRQQKLNSAVKKSAFKQALRNHMNNKSNSKANNSPK